MRRNTRLTWDGTDHASNIYDVWNYLSAKLRQLGETLREIDDQFYADSDRKSYISSVYTAMKVIARDSSYSMKVYHNIQSIEDLTSGKKAQIPRIKKAREFVMGFLNRVRTLLPKMEDFKIDMCQNVLQHLEEYCYDYHKLGITDDRFYKQLRVRIVRMKQLLDKFDKISSAMRSHSICSEDFCDDKFSEEIAIVFDCETFPVLRACPDMLQKLYVACDIAKDWLRSDKVYVEEIEKQIEQTKVSIKRNEDELELIKLEYSKIFSSLKLRQCESEYSEYADESTDETTNRLSRMEAARHRLQLEILAVSKLLLSCNDSLRVRGLRSTASPSHSDDDIPGGRDQVDGCNPERMGLASSRFRERVYNNSAAYSKKLQTMKHQLQKLQTKIKRKHRNLREAESANNEVERLTRKLKSVARKKTQKQEELHVLNDHLRQLENLLSGRKYPKPHSKRENLDEADGLNSSLDLPCTSLDVSNNCSEINFARKEGNLSADLRRAFRQVKNNIGFAWKDLARSLPYCPHKGLTEINNDIRAIEHENPGHLKEQAYQCLIRWYNHNGCHASLRDLVTCLRDINENRLADKLHGYIPAGASQSLETSPRANDSGID